VEYRARKGRGEKKGEKTVVACSKRGESSKKTHKKKELGKNPQGKPSTAKEVQPEKKGKVKARPKNTSWCKKKEGGNFIREGEWWEAGKGEHRRGICSPENASTPRYDEDRHHRKEGKSLS